MTPKEKAEELFYKYYYGNYEITQKCNTPLAKQCALIAVENEYHSLRELIFLLRSNRIIEDEKTFLYFIDLYNEEEAEVKQEIKKL